MRTSHVAEAVAISIRAGLPLLLEGAPGVGKSDLVAQACEIAGCDMILSHPAVSDPTDYKGFPWPAKSKKYAEFLPFGELYRALTATKKTVWFLDDLGQAPESVQAAAMQLLLARRVNEHVLPDCVVMLAATNGRAHRAGVKGILEPVKSRFVSILTVEGNLEDWKVWAYGAGIPAEIIAFLNWKPDLFHKFEASKDLVNSPSPRTWHNVGKQMNAAFPPHLEHEMFKGAIGEDAANQFVAFLKVWRDLPSVDGVLLDPDNARIPTEISALYAIITALARRASPLTYDAIVRYAIRINDLGRAEFAVLLVEDSKRVCPGIAHTAAEQKMILSSLGQRFAVAA